MPVVLALVSSVLWGLADFLGGLLTRSRPVLVVVGATQTAGLLAVVLVAVLVGPGPANGAYPWAVLAGLSGSAGLVAFYQALASGPMGVVSPIAALEVLVPVFVGIVRGERLSVRVVVGIVAAIAGIVAASGPELRAGASRRPLLLAAGSALGFGAALVFIIEGSRRNPLWTMISMRAVSVTIIGLVLAVTVARGRLTRSRAHDVAGPVRPGRPTMRVLGLVIVTGVADVSANLALGVASRSVYVSIVGVLGSLYPVVTVLAAMVVLGERLVRVQQLGVVVALAGVALVAAG